MWVHRQMFGSHCHARTVNRCALGIWLKRTWRVLCLTHPACGSWFQDVTRWFPCKLQLVVVYKPLPYHHLSTSLYGYASIPINNIFRGWTSIATSYFDVNRRGTRWLDPSPYSDCEILHQLIDGFSHYGGAGFRNHPDHPPYQTPSAHRPCRGLGVSEGDAWMPAADVTGSTVPYPLVNI